MKGHVDLLDQLQSSRKLMGIPSFETPDYSELFAEKKRNDWQIEAFLMVAGGAVQNTVRSRCTTVAYGASDILIEIYMAESTILRTEKWLKKEGETKVQEQIAMAKLLVQSS
jgi:predicted transcriptional regulator